MDVSSTNSVYAKALILSIESRDTAGSFVKKIKICS